MRALGLWVACLAAMLTSASAQVTVELTQDQDQFLPSESMPLAVRIINRSGQTLRLGRGEDWLTFSVETRDGQVVPKLAEVPVGGEFDLGSSEMATIRVDLAPYFALSRSGRYSVIATMRIKQWNQDVRSQPRNFDIIEGARLWEQTIGVPSSGAGTTALPEVRKFVLQQAHYLKSQLRLYVRLTDPTGERTFRVFPVGPMVSFGRPEPQVDKFSNLHVLYQAGPRSFNYVVINPKEGSLLAGLTIIQTNVPGSNRIRMGRYSLPGASGARHRRICLRPRRERPATLSPNPLPPPASSCRLSLDRRCYWIKSWSDPTRFCIFLTIGIARAKAFCSV